MDEFIKYIQSNIDKFENGTLITISGKLKPNSIEVNSKDNIVWVISDTWESMPNIICGLKFNNVMYIISYTGVKLDGKHLYRILNYDKKSN